MGYGHLIFSEYGTIVFLQEFNLSFRLRISSFVFMITDIILSPYELEMTVSAG